MSTILVSSERIPEPIASAPSTLIELLRLRALQQPDRVGFTFLADGESEESKLTFGDLEVEARAIGAGLQSLGAAGRRVLLLYPPGLQYIAAFFGCLYAGAIAVPAYPPRATRNLERLLSLVADCEAAFALTTEQVLSRLKPFVGRIPESASVQWLTAESLGVAAHEWREPDVDGETLAFLQYTSGSTSRPKGVMVTHANLLHNEEVIQRMFGQTDESVIVGWLPLYHDMGLIGNVLQTVYVGARCVLMSPVSFLQKPYRWLETISRYRATTSGGPNFSYDLCVRKTTPEEREMLDLSSWAVAFNGAEPIRADTLDRFTETFSACGFKREAFHPCYGLAEATLAVSGKTSENPITKTLKVGVDLHSSTGDDHGRRLVSCGSSTRGQAIAIVDPESGIRRPEGEAGEIWVSGPSIAKGYWNRPVETAQTFDAYILGSSEGPFLRTGDVGLQHEGELFVTGRLKDLIIIRGRNYYPQDIERTVEEASPSFRPGCGAAFSVEVDGEESLVVAQEVERHPEDLNELVSDIVQAVAVEHELQVHAVALLKQGSIPKTSSGKIQRHACRKAFLRGGLEAVAQWQAGTAATEPDPTREAHSEAQVVSQGPETAGLGATEQWLRARLAARLRLAESKINIDEPVIRYGIDSLAAVELAYEIENITGVAITLHTLLDGSSISQIAAQIRVGPGRQVDFSIGEAEPSRDAEIQYPLSRGQEALWFLNQMSPESPAYNISAAVRVTSTIDVAALRKSFQRLVDRHEMFRTTFSRQQPPVQRTHPQVHAFFHQIDAAEWTERELQDRLAEESRRPFDLENGPALRVCLFAESSGQHILLIAVHHMVADFWSLSITLRELGAIYTSEVSNGGSTIEQLRPPSMRYADYVEWQRQMLEGTNGQRLRDYWKRQLAGELPSLELPTDRSRPSFLTYNGGSFGLTIDESLTAELRALAERHGTTLFVTLLAAFNVLLYRYTSQEDLLVGSPTAGRSRSKMAGVVGYFVNPVVIRANLGGKPAFTEVLERVRRSVLEALENQDYPFGLLVEDIRPDRDPSRSPLFQTMFILQKAAELDEGLAALAVNQPGARISIGELQVESVALDKRIAQFDLTFTLAEFERGLVGSIEYNSDLFDESTIHRMSGHFLHLLNNLAAHPEIPIVEVPMMPAEERRRILVDWNRTAAPFDAESCIQDLFFEQSYCKPDAIALVLGDHALSYGELNRRSNQLAWFLADLGVRPETSVAVLMNRGVELVIALLGILKAGGAYVPLDPAYPEDRLAFMIEDSSAQILVTQSGLLDNLPALTPKTVCLDADWSSISKHSEADLRNRASSDSMAYMIYTSGSTGKPKGVMIQHRSAVVFLGWAKQTFTDAQLEGVLGSTSICFDLSIFELFGPLSCGGTVILVENVLELPRLGSASRVTLINTVPSAIAELVRVNGVPSSARTINLAGEALKQSLAEDVYRLPSVAQVWNLYGPSEDTTYSTFTLVERNAARPPSIGRAISNSEVYLLDEGMEAVPCGVPGEIYIGGEGLGRGYIGRAELTAERFVPDAFRNEGGRRLYRTGDIGRYLESGEIEYRGRADQQVKIRGYRVELGEIEAVMEELATVRQSVVVVREERGEKQLVGYVVLEEGIEGEKHEIRDHLRQRLPEYMLPRAIVTMEQVPMTPNGKVDRKRLPAPVRGDYDGGGGQTREASTEVEEELARIYAEMLGVEEVGVEDGFFELGGHSLLAMKLVSRIEERWGVEIGVRAIFEEPTVEGLARGIEKIKGAGTGAQIRRVETREGLPLSYAQQRMWFLEQMEPGQSVYNIAGAVRLRGVLSERALRGAMRDVVRRHEILRTRYEVENGEPVQRIDREGGEDLRVIDLREVRGREEEMRRIAEEEARRGFDLEIGPVMRQVLVRMSDHENVLVVVMHHIAADGWSLAILMKEVGEAYAEQLRIETGEEAGQRKEPVIQYGDYAVWQRERMAEQQIDEEIGYWREHLKGVEVLELPTDRQRPGRHSNRGGREALEIGEEVKNGLERIGRQEDATLFMVAMAAFKVLLWKYSGQDDIAVGTPIANREKQETQDLIGFFVNTAVMRTEVRGEETFRELVRREKEVALGAFGHQQLPFERLVEELQPERSVSHTPLFQVALSMHNASLPDLILPGLETSLIEIGSETSKFDLTLTLTETPRGLGGYLEYSTDLFNAGTVRRMAEHLRNLLEEVVGDPDAVVKSYSMMTAEEKQQVVVTWNQTAVSCVSASPVHEAVGRQALNCPDATALTCGATALSHAELNRRANRVARYLAKLGITREAAVAVLMERSPDMIVGMLGIMKAGAAYLPLDPTHPGERLAFMLRDAGVRLVLTQESLEGAIEEPPAPVVCVDRDWKTIAAESDEDFSTRVAPENLAYVIYTSGSTGRPKAVQITHAGLSNLVDWHDRSFEISSSDRATQLAGPGFDACVWEIWPYLATGASVHIANEETRLVPALLQDWLRDEGITVCFAPTPVAERLLSLEPWPQSALRTMLTGGEQLHSFPSEGLYFNLVNNYGPTETTVVATSGDVRPAATAGTLPSIGRAISNSEVYLLDEGMEAVPCGVPGEIYIGGEGLGRGYIGRAELTAERFVPDAFRNEGGRRLYRTGDIGRYLESGEIEYRGRADQQVKIRGYRVELGEIEAVMEELATVRQSVVVVREERGEKQLVGYVVLEEGIEGEKHEIRDHLRQRLPEYMLPRAIVTMEQVPMTPNGKVDRKRLPAPVRGDYEGGGGQTREASTEVEKELARIYAEMLGVEEVGVEDGFFELGGHSLLAMKLVSRIEERWGVEIGVRAIFEEPTVEGLARGIEKIKGAGTGAQIRRVETREGLPLSYAQQRMWFLEQMEPGQSVYNIAGAVRLRGVLSERALRGAMRDVVRRHEILRTRYEVENGEPVQRIDREGGEDLRVIDLREVRGREEEMRRIAEEEARRGFDLEIGPVMRQVLVRMSDHENVLVVVMHHIAADGWSLAILMKEVGEAYAEQLRIETGEEAGQRKEPVIQYGDYAVWQRERMAEQQIDEEIGYWREHLKGVEVLELPTDRQRPGRHSNRGGREALEIGEEVKNGLERIGRQEDATLFMVAMAAFKVLLWKYSGQDDIAVGTPIANREKQETQELIGFFVNTAVMRTEVRGEETFHELVRREKEVALGAFAHQQLPFERLVEELQPERSVSHTPLFQVMFVFQNAGLETPNLLGLHSESIAVDNGGAKFDLTMTVQEKGGGLVASAEFSVDLFYAATIRRMLAHFEVLLSAIAASADQRISQLELLPEQERERLSVDWNQTVTNYGSPVCLHQSVELQALRTPDAIAVVFEDEQLTFGELNAWANRLARHLQEVGAAPDKPVGIFMERSSEMVLALLGTLKSGAPYLPLDPEYPQERIDYMISDSKPCVLVTVEHLKHRVAHVAQPICLDTAFESFGHRESTNLDSGVTADDLAYVIYTSGSTGKPKAAMNTHRGIFNRLMWMQEAYQLTPSDTVLQKTPFSFDVSVWEFFWPLMTGAPLVLARPSGHQDPSYLVEKIRREGITTVHFVPSMLQVFLEEDEVSSCSSLQRVICSGEALSLDLQQRFFERMNADLHNLYGPTEAAVDVTYWHCDASKPRRSVPIGRPIANIQCYVLDPTAGLAPVGVAGELHLGGVGLARGYLNRPDLTGEKFVPNPIAREAGERLYRTGDLARWSAEGEIEYLGRIDSQVKVRGFRIELGEVESVLAEHPQIRETVVVAGEASPGDKRLTAYVVTNQPSALSPEELREFLKPRLPDFMIPSSFQFLSGMPLTPNGKTDRRSLPAPDFACTTSETPRLAPRNGTEEAIASIWREVLKIEEVGVHDNFFDLGGHSLLVVRVHRRLRECLKHDLSLVELFKHPTISSLASHVEELPGNGFAESNEIQLQKTAQAKNRLRGLLGKGRRPANG